MLRLELVHASRVSKIVVQFVPGVNYAFVRCNGFGSFRLQLLLQLPAVLAAAAAALVVVDS